MPNAPTKKALLSFSTASDDTGTDDLEFAMEIVGAKPTPENPEVKLELRQRTSRKPINAVIRAEYTIK